MDKVLVAFLVQVNLGCDLNCIQERLATLERRYDDDLRFQELTRVAHGEFDDKMEIILVSSYLRQTV